MTFLNLTDDDIKTLLPDLIKLTTITELDLHWTRFINIITKEAEIGWTFLLSENFEIELLLSIRIFIFPAGPAATRFL